MVERVFNNECRVFNLYFMCPLNFIVMNPKHLILSAAAAMLLAAGCTNEMETISPSGMTLNESAAEIVKGETLQLLATVEPEGATYEEIAWTSDAPEVASVDMDGLVTALSVGEATITASIDDSFEASCKITVVGPAAESIALDAETMTLLIGATAQLTATPSPEDADVSDLVWSSSDEGVAEVDANGMVTAIAAGKATVSVAVGSVKASCEVTVTAPAQVGDFFYSDGTWSTEQQSDKECIGIVFAVGHNEYDVSDYSGTGIGTKQCNGYVIALNDVSSNWAMWGPQGVELGLYPKDEFGDPVQNGRENGQYNDWSGYLYSQIVKQTADQNGGLSPDSAEGYPLFYYAMVSYAEQVPAPANTSGWFLPSISQIYQSLGVSDELSTVNGATEMANDWYASSSEASVDNPGPQDYFRYLNNMNMGDPFISADGKDIDWFLARAVLAF